MFVSFGNDAAIPVLPVGRGGGAPVCAYAREANAVKDASRARDATRTRPLLFGIMLRLRLNVSCLERAEMSRHHGCSRRGSHRLRPFRHQATTPPRSAKRTNDKIGPRCPGQSTNTLLRF